LGLNPGWVFAAIGFCVYSAWWAIPMCLVGAMQRRYITKTSPVVRSALAEQAHLGFERVNIDRDRFCPAHRCGARVSAAAKFCPRCGAGV
jgi:ribosomal protein S27AE